MMGNKYPPYIPSLSKEDASKKPSIRSESATENHGLLNRLAILIQGGGKVV